MSWFARSIANSLKLDNYDVEEADNKQYLVKKNTDVSTNQKDEHQIDDAYSRQSLRSGVKEDFSEITKALTHQFWGVASFLAPPLSSERSDERSESSDREPISGVCRDFAEIGGRFRSGISKLSNNIDVSGITKLASDILQLESEDDDDDSTDGDGAVAVTDEVVAFASDIAMHPATWLNFPLPEDEDDDEDFDLSDAQLEHVSAVEHLAPRLSALRIEICPSYMTESSFWKIYFVLLHPRLDPHAAELLSTPKIVKARAMLTHKLKNSSCSETMSDSKPKSLPVEISVIETVKHPIKGDDFHIVEKSVIQDGDDWLKEESSEIVISRVAAAVQNDEDVSFSDLEDDDDDDDEDENIPIHYKKGPHTSDSSTKDSTVYVYVQ